MSKQSADINNTQTDEDEDDILLSPEACNDPENLIYRRKENGGR